MVNEIEILNRNPLFYKGLDLDIEMVWTIYGMALKKEDTLDNLIEMVNYTQGPRVYIDKESDGIKQEDIDEFIDLLKHVYGSAE